MLKYEGNLDPYPDKYPSRDQMISWILDRGEEPAATLSELAVVFGVDRRRVERWYRRRASTGFPEAPWFYRRGPVQTPKLWNLHHALSWRERWTPHPGGAPIGNRNNPSGRAKTIEPTC